MAHENAQSESLKQLVEQLDAAEPVVLLPEFQRDFVWEMEQTYALFDSLIRGIFVGSIIYGKPSFEMALRKVDRRPRTGKGSRAKLESRHYTEEEVKTASQTRGLKILLDGQQRTTSLYRALKGDDRVFYAVRPDVLSLSSEEFKASDLESLMHPEDGIRGADSPDVVCVPVDYAFQCMMAMPRERELQRFFEQDTERGKALEGQQDELDAEFEVFLQVLSKFRTMFEQPQLLSYYLLDMELDKFTTFFERSNSKGIQLNFTDILAAKVFGQFNLRQKFDDFSDAHPDLPLNRELMVRAIAIMSGEFDKVDKAILLKRVKAEHFKAHWDEMTNLMVKTLQFLHDQKLLISVRWLPYDNILVPLMMFFRALGQRGQSTPSEKQWKFLQWWYWAAIFSERYTAATNEKLVQDSRLLVKVANGEDLDAQAFARLRPGLTVDDLFSYTRSQSAVYRGVFNLVHFAAGGLKDWRSGAALGTGSAWAKDLHDHHYFPRAYLRRTEAQQDVQEVSSIMDSVLNRVLMPKDANFSASDKKPFVYLNEFTAKNPKLAESMASHLVPLELLHDESASQRVEAILTERAEQILARIRAVTVDVEPSIRAAHIPQQASPSA